jgi:hypothetical protein
MSTSDRDRDDTDTTSDGTDRRSESEDADGRRHVEEMRKADIANGENPDESPREN